MKNFEKMALEAFEKGKEDSYLPQEPFVSFGFESNPFASTTVEELEKEVFLQSRIYKISRYLGQVYSSFLEKQQVLDGNENPILDGVLFYSRFTGVSTLLQFTLHLLKKNPDLKNLVYIDAEDLVVFENNKFSIAKSIQNFRNALGEYEQQTVPSLVLIDHSDSLIEFFETFRDTFERDFHETTIIFVFSHSGWTKLKSSLAYSSYDLHNKILQSRHIDPLTNDELKYILTVKLSKEGKIQQPFSEEIISAITKNSQGNLYNAIRLTTRICEECFYNGLDNATIALVQDISSVLGISVTGTFYDLVSLKDNTQTTILALIAMKSVSMDYGITYDEIVMNLNIQKTSVSHHLKQLEEKNYVNKQTLNRKAYYRLKDELKTIADSVLLPKFEKKEHYVKLEKITDLA